ncbi:MAG: hypothetical protein HRT61_23565, partial [Ekhidna sp.]|nr:hypothetical protein [Ekhidna sp.]
MKILLTIAGAVLLLSCSNDQTPTTPQKEPIPFVSTSSVEEVRAQIEKLSKDDIWWNVYGEDQRWNHRNLHRFYPAVNIYREGQVNMLNERLIPEIPKAEVETPEGKMTFKEFIDSDQSTTMGIVIVQAGE